MSRSDLINFIIWWCDEERPQMMLDAMIAASGFTDRVVEDCFNAACATMEARVR